MSTCLKRALASFRLVDIGPSVGYSSRAAVADSFSSSNRLLFHLEFFKNLGGE